MLPGIADEVPDNQKVSRELHLLDDGKLARQPLLVVRQIVLQLALLVERPQCLSRRRAKPSRVTCSK